MRLRKPNSLAKPISISSFKSNIASLSIPKKISISALIILSIAILPAIFASGGPMYNTRTQTNWNGGVGPDTASQYTSLTDLSTTTEGEINFGGSATPGKTGSLVSAVFDMGNKVYFGNVLIDTVGNGEAKIQIRSASNSDMTGAIAWDSCNMISDEDDIYSSTCVRRPEKYLQYRIILTNDANPDDFSVIEIGLQYQTDDNAPRIPLPTILPLSSKIRNTPTETYTWDQLPEVGYGWLENYSNDSGVAGVKYCTVNGIVNDIFSYCDSISYPEHFVGPSGGFKDSGLLDEDGQPIMEPILPGTPEYLNDVYPVDANRLTTSPNDPNYSNLFSLSEMLSGADGQPLGLFGTFIIAVDNVGNISNPTWFINKYTSLPSGGPQEVKMTNTTAGTNMFEATWSHPGVWQNPMIQMYQAMGLSDEFIESEMIPTFSLFEGSDEERSYCYTINSSPNPNDANYDPNWLDNCIHTPKAATSLPASNYGLKQGTNTLYMASMNEAGNILPYANFPIEITDDEEKPVLDDKGNPTYFNYEFINYSETNFYVETFAPDLPRNVEVVDISNRTTETWRTVLSWIAPEKNLVPVEEYRIFRSTDGKTWGDNIGNTDSLSYVDTDSSLNNKTTYYYQVRACDNADSCSDGVNAVNVSSPEMGLGITPDGRYTEPADLTSGPSASNISTRKATINWQTNRESDSKVFISTTAGVSTDGDYSAGNASQVSSHDINLINLQPNTKYYYKVTWTDIDNNIGISPEKSFTTVAAPSFSEVTVDTITINSASVSFTVKDASMVNIYYGKTESYGGAKTVNTSLTKSAYQLSLSELDDGTKYYIKLNGFDSDGNEYPGSVYSFSTLPRPIISNLRFQPVDGAASNTTIVSWNTNIPATSMLSYGTSGENQKEIINSKFTTEHEITISELADDSIYSLVASSRDEASNLVVSDPQTFRTALDTRPPKISKINVDTAIRGSGSEAKGQVIVSWSTDEPATSQVAFGQGSPGNYNNKSVEDSTLSLEHTVIISDLSTSSIYQIQPLSKDKAGNEGKGTNQSAIVGRGTEDVFTIIFNSLRNIFGIR